MKTATFMRACWLVIAMPFTSLSCDTNRGCALLLVAWQARRSAMSLLRRHSCAPGPMRATIAAKVVFHHGCLALAGGYSSTTIGASNDASGLLCWPSPRWQTMTQAIPVRGWIWSACSRCLSQARKPRSSCATAMAGHTAKQRLFLPFRLEHLKAMSRAPKPKCARI